MKKTMHVPFTRVPDEWKKFIGLINSIENAIDLAVEGDNISI